jgi:cyanophycin synthetase
MDSMNTKDIKFLEIRYLRGPNIWTYRPVIEAVVDIGELEDYPSNTIPGFVDRLKAFLPSLIEHRCSYGERGGFLRRLDEGTWPGHILEHVTLELQNLAGMPGGFGKARETSIRGVYKVVVRAWHEDVTRACLEAGRELVMAAIQDRPFDVAANVEHLREMAEHKLLGPSTGCIVEAATSKERRIPAIRMLANGNMVQLGYGVRSRRIWTAETDRTSAIAETISRDKDLARSLLQSCGVPVPEGQVVDDADEAWDAVDDVETPLIIRPAKGLHGRSVFAGETPQPTRENVDAAYAAADATGCAVLVERHIEGSEHRLLMVGGKLVAATRSEIVSVIGDGRSTISELVAATQKDLVLATNSEAIGEIAQQGFTPDTVPPLGREVVILSTGTHAHDITDNVHPATAEMAALAARVIGLDIAGVDVVCKDISRPLESQGGAIVDVNAGPGLLMHIKPASGEPRPVGKAIVEHLFPNGDSGRIPLVGVTGSYGKTTVAAIIARLLTLSGKHTALTSSKGVFLDRRQTEKGDCANWTSAHRILMNRAIEAAVFENGSDTILSEGLAYDRCQIGVVTNVDIARHTGRYYIDKPEHVFNVLRTQVDLVLPNGAAVLNAREPMLVEMASLCDGEVIYFALDPQLPVISEHLSHGKRAVIVRYDQIMLASAQGEVALIRLTDIPLTQGGKDTAQVENMLAAIAVAWALDVSLDVMRTGVETFFIE